MMVRIRNTPPLARTRSPPTVASFSKPCRAKSRVHPCARGGLARFLRSSTRVFFFLDIASLLGVRILSDFSEKLWQANLGGPQFLPRLLMGLFVSGIFLCGHRLLFEQRVGAVE